LSGLWWQTSGEVIPEECLTFVQCLGGKAQGECGAVFSDESVTTIPAAADFGLGTEPQPGTKCGDSRESRQVGTDFSQEHLGSEGIDARRA
jgi:hypothetical protein